MKQNLLFNRANAFGMRFIMVLTMLLIVGVGQAWGAEEVVYTLTPASGSNNSYAGNCDVTIDDIKWNLTGNSTTTYWRIGGKSITNVDRALYSKTAIQEDISKIVISHGAASSITVNSVKLIVSTASNGTGTTISSLDGSFSANSTMTFTRPAGTSWANAYYKFVYNVTVSGSSNKFVEFKEAKFYAETVPAVSYNVTWKVNGEIYTTGSPSTSVSGGGKVTKLPTNPTLDCSGKTFVGWSNEEVTDGNEPDALFTIAENSPAITGPTTFHAVFATKGSNQTATFDAATISGLTKSSSTLTWTHNNSGIALYLSAGQRYTSGTPNTFTVTNGTSNYCQLSAPVGVIMSKVVATLSGTNYKINSVSTPWTLSTSSTTQTISSTSGSDYLKMSATSSYQIRITKLVVTYTTYSDYTTQCTTETVVTLNPNGGKIDGSNNTKEIQTENGTLTLPEPTRDCYTFTNWNTNENGTGDSFKAGEISNWDSKNTTLYAQWTQITYTITWKNGDVVLETDDKVPCGTTPTYDSATPTKPSTAQYTYAFSGWSPEIYAADKDQVYTAQFSETLRQYTVTFNANGHGTAPDAQKVDYNKKATEPSAPTATGYTFGGWYKESGCTNAWNFATDVVTGDITLYAKWTEKPLTNYRTFCDVVCDAYSFHTGTGERENWLKEAIKCFTKAEGGYEHEWQIKDYIIPVDDKFFVGNYGYFYNDNLGIGGTNGKSRSVVSDWGNMYLAPAMDENDAEGTPRLGHAKGAKGTLRIFEDSNWDNLFVGFIPDGYKLKFGNEEYTFAKTTGAEYRSEVVEYNSTNADKNVSVGVVDADGKYVATNHTQEMRHIFLKDNCGWRNDGAKLAIYYWGGSEGWCGFLKTVPGDETLFEGWIPSNATYLKFVRYNSNQSNPGSWDYENDIWNSTGDLTIDGNLFTITDWGTGTWSTYEKYGQFAMHDNSKSKNWYVHFVPHYVLTYDKNAEDATGTMDIQTVAVDATDKDVPVASCGFTRVGYDFKNWRKDETSTYYNAGVNIELSADITLYAQWTAKKIKITWDANGGSVTPTSSTYTYNGATITPPTPTRANYIFNGWFTAATGGTEITEVGTNNKPTDDVTYYAQWTAKETPTFAWSADSYTAALEADNTFPTLNNPGGLSVTYTSSDENVAKIDANGNITLGAEGRTTITAIGAESASHKAAKTTYELTVVAANCKWVETDIANINSDDEVIVAMVTPLGVYTLDHSKGTSAYPPAELIEIVGNEAKFLVTSHSNSIWNISGNANDGYILRPNGDSRNALYCTATKYNVKVGTGTDNLFTIDGGYLLNKKHNVYVGVYNSSDWRHYPANTGNAIAGQTLKFYKRECLDATNYWVTWDAGDGAWEDGSSKKLDSYAVGATIATPSAPEREGYRFDGWNPNPTTMPAQNTTFTAKWTKLHTITWMVGSNSVLTEKIANAKGVTQTPADPANGAIGECANAFMGWTETSLGSAEGQSAPADLCTAAQMKAKHTSVTGNKTFYAVFATKEGGEDYLQISNESDLVAGSKYLIVGNSSSTYRALPVDNASNLTNVYPSSSKISNPADGLIWTLEGAADRWKIKSASNNKYLQITGGALTFVENTTFTFSVSVASSKFTFTSSASSGNKVLSYYHNGNCFNAYTTANNVYIYKQDIDYSNYVTNCCALAPATNLTVSATTANSATLTWTAPSPATGITKLQVRNAETDAVVVDNIDVNTTAATITELEECTSYQYYVVSVGECEVVSNTVTATPFSGAKTVNYDYNGGTGLPASFTTSCENQKIILPNATRPGYTFNGWFDAASGGNLVGVAGAEYNPATSPITLHAQWTETNYTLTHKGSNYTNTENKTTIKSSETPLTLNYTCTGDYGLPATISITGGGKSWTVGTDYTWEVAADRQSAILVIKETVISANVTITINVATRYTVTFIHNDKGIFDGSETLEVLSTENTITLPNITNVSCGFYDTFEGWIISNSEYVESTTKPATVYSGGASYKVTDDCTFRALYSKCEGDATQVYRKVTSTAEVTDGTYILVANTSTPRVYSGYGGATYGSSVEGLTADGEDFSTTLPVDAKPITVTTGTGTSAGTFAMYNADRNKYLTYTGSSNTLDESDSKVFIWKLTDGSDVSSRSCPAGVLTPNGFDTRVLQCNTSSSNRFACYTNNASFPHVFLYKLIDKCTKYYSTNPSCEKPVGVHIVYNANAVDASMSCSTQDRTYKVENEVNKYPQLASQLQFCTNATRDGYTLVGWNTQSNGQGTTYNINQNYYNLPVSGELDDDKWITLNLYAIWKPCVKFNLGNATGGTGVPDAVVENGECVLPEPTAEQLGTIPCGYEFYAWSETSVNATQTKPALFMPGDTYTGSALTLYAVYRLCETGSNADLFSLSYTISGTKYYVGPVLDTRENRSTKFSAVTNENDATVFGMKSVEGQTYKSLFWVDSEENNKYMYWKDYGASFQFTSEEDDSYGWTVTGTTKLTFVSTPYMTKGSRYLSADASEIGCPSEPKAVTQFTKEMASTMICTYATEPECSTTATLQFVTNGGILNYPTTYDANSYQNLTPGSTVYLPTATFAGEWVFEGWMKDEPLTSQNLKPETVNFIEVELDITTYSASKTGTTTFYAVYSKTNDDKQFDPVNGGTYKLYAIGADDTKTYMPIWSGGRGTPSGVTTCAEAGDYTITPGTGTHAGQYQITCGEYTLGVVSGNTDLNKVEGTWWNIEPSTSGKGTWRITVAGSTDDRALSCSFSTAKSFGNYAISNLNKPSQSIYRDMEIGECIYTEYTSTPENTPYITITGAPVKITSANGERVYASTTIHIEAHNFTGERIIHLSATNGFGVDPAQVRTNGQGAYSGNVKVYYEPTTDGDGQTITTSVLTASQTGGTNAEKISQTFAAIQGRNMPANFVIAAKWDGHWYALPANCTSSLSSTEGLLIEVNDMNNPTIATAAPASAKYGLREVIPSRQTDYGQGIVFTERFAEGDKQFALYNGSEANIQVNAQYSNYAQTNPDKYEWIPTTSDFNEYTLTNASTGRNLGLTSGSFGAYTAASNQVRLLPTTFYEPAQMQVLKWKANSVIVMYTGPETTATTQVGDNAKSAEQALANQQLTHGIYELTTNQALTDRAGGELNIYIGTNTRVELEIPLIISGEVTASANAHDVVILENSKLTAAATKYSYKDVYVYGGAKLAIPENTELGVNNIILRAGGVATDGAGQNATYQYIYPQVELKGTLTSAVQNIRYEYVTDNDHWYHLVLPFDGSLASIHYPYEYYGDQVKLDNKGSWIIKRYDGATRATGNYDAWKNIEEDVPEATVVKAGHGYIYWGAPKKVTANGVYERPKWGIQRITMLSDVSETIAKAIEAENADKTISGLGSYKNVANNSLADNDQGWNLIGNPYMVNLTGLNSKSLKTGKLIEERDANGNWTGGWVLDSINATLRYITVPSHHFEWYTAEKVSKNMTLDAGRAFFVQIDGTATDVMFEAANRAQLMPALRAAHNDEPVDIETGIVLSNETLQDEVNFWIADGMTSDYEYNADYPKTPNNNNFNIYGVHTNGHLSWVATGPEYAAESMPIGYQVPDAGTYMLSVSEEYYSDEIDALYVTDHEMSPEVTTDLMSAPYEFSVNQAETNDKRFTVSIKLKKDSENDATGLDNININGEEIQKFIYQDKMYILHHGIIYDATGKRVITINK